MGRTLADYLETELKRRGWSRRTLAMYADVSPETVSAAVRGTKTPNPDTIRKFATALEANEAHLLRLAGHLEATPKGLTSADAVEIAKRIEALPPEVQREAVQAINAQLDMADRVARINRLYEEVRRLVPDALAEVEEEMRREADEGPPEPGPLE